jgi:hypothetical protein
VVQPGRRLALPLLDLPPRGVGELISQDQSGRHGLVVLADLDPEPARRRDPPPLPAIPRHLARIRVQHQPERRQMLEISHVVEGKG